MTSKTLKERARDLLNLHEGKCSVPCDSKLFPAFCEMQDAGEVVITESGSPGYMDIRQKEGQREAPKV